MFLHFIAPRALADEVDSVRFDLSANSVTINGGDSRAKRCVLARRLTHVAPRLNWNKSVIY